MQSHNLGKQKSISFIKKMFFFNILNRRPKSYNTSQHKSLSCKPKSNFWLISHFQLELQNWNYKWKKRNRNCKIKQRIKIPPQKKPYHTITNCVIISNIWLKHSVKINVNFANLLSKTIQLLKGTSNDDLSKTNLSCICYSFRKPKDPTVVIVKALNLTYSLFILCYFRTFPS